MNASVKPVAVDVMGGDLGSSVIVEGAVLAHKENGRSIILVGNESEINEKLSELGEIENPKIVVKNATAVITMNDSPAKAIRSKPDASILVAFGLVKEGIASSVVSPGNTGAMMAAGLFISGTLPGIVRPAIASLIPRISGEFPTILLDAGANIDCSAQQLVQFAIMGELYAKIVSGITCPKVGLISNGTEESKGTDIIRAAARELCELNDLNYVGFIEGRDISRGHADVVVCDGFVGNVILKTMEGTAELVIDSIKQSVEGSVRGTLGMALAKPYLKKLFHEKLDPSAYGGAPLLGLNDVGIVCHGKSNARAILNAVKVAERLANADLCSKLSLVLSGLQISSDGYSENGVWQRIGQKFDKGRKNKTEKNSEASES